MKDAPAGKEFVFHDGNKVKNVSELLRYLELFGRREFSNYVNDEKNDFANWIEYVIEERELSSKLRQTKDFDETIILLGASAGKTASPADPILKKNPKKLFRNVFQNVKTQNAHSDQLTAHHEMHTKKISPAEEDPLYTSEKQSKGKILDGSKKWFRLAQKKIKERKENIQNKKIHGGKSHDVMHEEHLEGGLERIFWVFLYVFVVVLIILLVIYKFVFPNIFS